MKTLGIIFARMDSTRLPGKVLMDIDGVPLLTRLANRVKKAKLDGVMLATTARDVDDELVAWAVDNDLHFFRGPNENCLLRCVKAAQSWGAPDIIVRVCGDTPLIDPTMIDVFVEMVKCGYRMARSINTGRKFPQGTTAHVCYLKDLRRILRESDDPAHREHVTLALYEDGPFKVPTFEMVGTQAWACPPTRLQVDYPEDLQLVREVQRRLGPGDDFGIQDIVNLLRKKPMLRLINAHCEEKAVR